MIFRLLGVLLFCQVAICAVAKKDRVIKQALSDKEPGSPDYDHEAFVGSEEAETFKELSSEESQRRLGVIADKIDKDKNGKITQEELKDWIVFTQLRYIRDDSDKQFVTYDKNKDNKIDWEEYKEMSYGFLKNQEFAESDSESDNYKQMMERDERRFKQADIDGDHACNAEEFRAFLHPEQHEHMKGVVVRETLEDIDKNKDGFVDVDEYVGDMYKQDDGGEPEWVANEREQFTLHRDVNKDGKLDEKEVQAWIMPDDYNHPEAEAKHLIQEADDDKDGMLTKEEILNHHDTFVGSQATDWGEALQRHDEF